jgi:Flp pilus assembly protein TadD
MIANAAARGSGRRPDLIIGLVLAALILVAFWPVLDHEFVSFDDPGYVTDNPVVLTGLTADGAAWAFTTGAQGNWHPLTWISHMVDVAVFGAGPRGHHLTSLLLHLVSTLLLFAFLRGATGTTWLSGFVAALFAIHPLRVESVAWVAERKDVLSTVFFMLTLLAYLGYARRPDAGRYVLVVTLYSLGLMAKPMLVSLPFVLLLLDFWPLDRCPAEGAPTCASGPARSLIRRAGVWRLLLEKVPLLALAAASSVVTLAVQRGGDAVRTLEQVPLAERLANAVLAYAVYVRKMLFPADLAFFYPFPSSFSAVEVGLAASGILLVTLAAVRYARRLPYLFSGWFWYVGMLVPVIGIVQVGSQSMADRYTYVPLVGLFLLLTWGAHDLLSGLRNRNAILACAGFLVIALLVPMTRAQVRTWRNSMSLFERALQVTEGNYVAHDLLGVELHRIGRPDEAMTHYAQALTIRPGYPYSHNNLGVALAEQGRYTEAESHYRAALVSNDRYSEAHNNLGIALASLGRVDEALEHFASALLLEPEDPEIHHNLGIAWSIRGDTGRAVEHFLDALRLEPEWHSVATAAAWILATHPDPAVRDGREAVRLAERVCRAHGGGEPRQLDTLAAAYAESGNFDAAVRTASRAAELAEARREPALARGIRARAEGYRSGLPHREPAASPTPGEGR